MSARPWAFALLAAWLPACLAPPHFPALPDGGTRVDAALPPLSVVALRVEDARGEPWPADAAPRLPVIRLEFSSPPFGTDTVLLLTGAPDADLLSDLDEAPLRATTLARAVVVDATLEGSVLTLIPRAPLDAGEEMTIAVPRFVENAAGERLAAARADALRISTAASAGARATDSWPPDGAFDVAPTLALAAMRFDGVLDQPSRAVVLRDAAGHPIDVSAEVTACTSVGWSSGTCVSLVPTAPLAPAASYVLAVAASARDAAGASLPAFEAHFATAASDPAPLSLLDPTCAMGETAVEDVCTRADDESISVHAQLSSAARLRWTLEDRQGALVTPRGVLALRVGDLPSAHPTTLAIEAIDYAGRTTTLSLPLSTTEPLPPIAITEVRADPFGPEPRQEYVEIANEGPIAVSLDGMRLADSPTAEGDALPAISIPPGARALIVASTFDPDDDAGGRDAIVPPGALLVRLDASIASGGLSNAGEPLTLRDGMQRWISAAPATPGPRSGVCIVRVATSLRTGEPGSFEYDANETCTPGR